MFHIVFRIIDRGSRAVFVGERGVSLTPSEFTLLTTLMASPRQVFPRQRLLDRLAGEGWPPSPRRRGLAIAKAIVEAHGGTIAVTSTVGTGTTFAIALPAVGDVQSPAPRAFAQVG